jgi:hypothetical protein
MGTENGSGKEANFEASITVRKFGRFFPQKCVANMRSICHPVTQAAKPTLDCRTERISGSAAAIPRERKRIQGNRMFSIHKQDELGGAIFPRPD